MLENQASCQIYGLLKRPDEKFVTEEAYDNPKFTEDIIRDVAVTLNKDDRISAYKIESENFESIHNHSAYAYIEKDKKNIGQCWSKFVVYGRKENVVLRKLRNGDFDSIFEQHPLSQGKTIFLVWSSVSPVEVVISCRGSFDEYSPFLFVDS